MTVSCPAFGLFSAVLLVSRLLSSVCPSGDSTMVERGPSMDKLAGAGAVSGGDTDAGASGVHILQQAEYQHTNRDGNHRLGID
jgi:hypothetical protein